VFESTLGDSGGPLGTILGALEVHFGSQNHWFYVSWGLLGIILGASGVHFGSQNG